MMLTAVEELKPTLSEPFPNVPRHWKDPKTDLIIPKFEVENIEWRGNLLKQAENDLILRRDLLTASKQSLEFWTNTFVWTYHQFDVNPETGERIEARQPHNPFITWEIQDELLSIFLNCLKVGEDILIDKCRDMGASWICVLFLHWLWLFRPDSQLLEMSRTQDYVDQTGNMKALFQKHDYINSWLPEWMLPPSVSFGEKYRTKMHMKNIINGSVIDGESTTEHAASGDRRLIGLLDEFAKVEHGQLMRSATRDACYVRIINSTPAGPGTEYSKWKKSAQIKIFVLPFHEHPEKGKDRYVRKTETGNYEIRSPWFDHEETVRSPQEMAREILRQDLESGSVFFTIPNIEKHIALFAKDARTRYHIHFKSGIPNDAVFGIIRRRDIKKVSIKRGKNGPLRVWCKLIADRPDQSKTYIFGIDLGKGQGASNSVISIKCKETGEKIAEWRDANTPPYDMARIAVALALWCGGRAPRRLPFLKWENNGPGWDFGKIVVRIFKYAYFYKKIKPGQVVDKKTMSYGFHTNTQSKFELLSLYDRVLAHGGYINHSKQGLEEAKYYVHFKDGGIGPAILVEESASAKKTHGDIVIADALTLDDSDLPKIKHTGPKAPSNSFGARYEKAMGKKKANDAKSWRQSFRF
ncbi:hypothetical protein LCGC14_0359840 [marine sediment metagenome]|uniref:Terminase large subunit gp17-like C-terminal domain-containing protein n=1 Tax=marine sediment metagenome TaxID=412755 RepID=A0A0F9T895_9ZZZZ